MTESPLNYLEAHFDQFLSELTAYAAIPSVSFAGYPAAPLRQSAQWTASKMQAIGLQNVEILEIPGAPPYVYGDWLHAPGRPTVLLYGHHDVQPPGRDEHWKNHPFQPTLRDGRLYGRGVVDDKAGVLMHLAAVEAYLKTNERLPVNVRFIVEGEEETGSAHLAQFLGQYREKLKSDVMVLTDTANLQEGLPSITYCLRGIIDAVLEVRTLQRPIHSGMWGGPLPDALTVLTQVLARLTDQKGRIAIPGFYDGILEPTPFEKDNFKKLPFIREAFLQEAQAVSALQLAGESDYSVYERIWSRPALAILGVDAPAVEKTSNQIVESARAKISVRLVSGQDPDRCLKLLADFLRQNPPWGAEIKVFPGAAGHPWKIKPEGLAFQIAQEALKKGFDCDPVFIGCGGSIPFVKPMTEAFGDIPALLIGIEDPACNAHGENESLSLSDWKKGMRSAVHLYEGLASFQY